MTIRADKAAQLALLEQRLATAAWAAVRSWLKPIRVAVLHPPGLVASPDDLPDPSQAVADPGAWSREVEVHLGPVIEAELARTFTQVLPDGALSDQTWQRAYLADLPNRVANLPETTFTLVREHIDAAITSGTPIPELRDQIAQTLSVREGGAENAWRKRAAAIARTEATATMNGGTVAAVLERDALLGDQTDLFWISTIDARTREDHFAADGQRVPAGTPFLIGGEQLLAPGDPKASAKNRVNCRCAVGEVPAGDPLPDVGDRQLSGESDQEIARRAQTGTVRDRDAVTAAAGGDTMPRTWSGPIAPIGVNSGDRRRFASGGEFSYRPLPLPLMFQDESSFGHDGSGVVGRILAIEVRDNEFWGSGDYLDDPAFAEPVAKAIALAEAGLGHVSVDLADLEVSWTDENGVAVTEEQMWAAWEEGEDFPVYEQYDKASIIGATQVSKPAFAEAIITPDEASLEGDLEAALVDGAGVEVAVGVTVDVAAGDGYDAFTGTVTAVDEETDEVTVQPEDADASPVTVPLADVTVQAAEDEEEEDGASQVASLTASAALVPQQLRWRPDAELFADPELQGATAMTIGKPLADGSRRVFGHIGTWGQCHVAFAQCVTPPREESFDYFHVGAVELADGSDLAIGKLVLGGGHASVSASYQAAVSHYDRNGAGVAFVRAYADASGIAVAGIIPPWVTDEQVVQMKASVLSGDWRPVGGGPRRLAGALAVHSGGFPVPRYGVDGRGRIAGLVAAGAVPRRVRQESYEQVARRVFAQERMREKRRAQVAALTQRADAAMAATNRSALGKLLAGVR